MYSMAERSAEAPERIPIFDYLIHRPADSASRELLLGLTPGVAVLEAAPVGLTELAKCYSAVLASQQSAPVRLERPLSMIVVSAGPALDSPDTAEIEFLNREGTNLRLRLRYSSARTAGRPLLRNVPWRPVVQVRCDAGKLEPGSYRLIVEWRNADSDSTDPVQIVRFAVLR